MDTEVQKVLDELTLNITSAAPAVPTKARRSGRYVLVCFVCVRGPSCGGPRVHMPAAQSYTSPINLNTPPTTTRWTEQVAGPAEAAPTAAEEEAARAESEREELELKHMKERLNAL